MASLIQHLALYVPSGPTLLVARGNSAKPVFETVQLPLDSPTDGPSPVIALEPCPDGVLLPAGTLRSKQVRARGNSGFGRVLKPVQGFGDAALGTPRAWCCASHGSGHLGFV